MARNSNSTTPQDVNMIGQGTIVEGSFQAKNDVRISGRVLGKIDIEGKAFLTQEGEIEGELRADNADIGGTFKGEIHVKERVVLKGTARIDGDIHTGRLVVEEGAMFNGRSFMGPGQQAKDVAASGANAKNSTSASSGDRKDSRPPRSKA